MDGFKEKSWIGFMGCIDVMLFDKVEGQSCTGGHCGQQVSLLLLLLLLLFLPVA